MKRHRQMYADALTLILNVFSFIVFCVNPTASFTTVYNQPISTIKKNHPTILRATMEDTNVINLNSIPKKIIAEITEISECASIAFGYFTKDQQNVTPKEIVELCDSLVDDKSRTNTSSLYVENSLKLRNQAMQFGRYHLLVKLLKKDYESYVATASFLSPSFIPRKDLPNIQDVPLNDIMPSTVLSQTSDDSLVEDCQLENKEFSESLLDKILLQIFRNLVTKFSGGVTSDKPGIDGLLEQGRIFMLKPNQTSEAQHKMVYDTLGALLTPALPPFYRIFMTGIVPNLGTKFDGKQIGPWFYAPWMTTIVTPIFFGFLVGPSRPNRRKDGERGGLVVEKCKFLQESGCKGLCLHQCKLPAQQVFSEKLGLELTVSPNFATQECQWSFGEKPLLPQDDPYFPQGCLTGCQSRTTLAEQYSGSMGSCN